MTITLDLTPEQEAQLQNRANRQGTQLETVISRMIADDLGDERGRNGTEPRLSTEQVPFLKLTSPQYYSETDRRPTLPILSEAEIERLNAPSIARLNANIAEAANATPEEIAQAEAEWHEFTEALNEERRLVGARLLFP